MHVQLISIFKIIAIGPIIRCFGNIARLMSDAVDCFLKDDILFQILQEKIEFVALLSILLQLKR